MEWVEVRGRTVEEAVRLGVQELGLESVEAAEVEILKQPQRGFLGIGGQDALVRIKPRPKRRRRHRRSRSGGGEGAGTPTRGRGETGQRSGSSRGRGRGQESRGRQDGRGGRPARDSSAERRPKSMGRRETGETPATEEAGVEQPTVTIGEQAEIVRGFLVGLLDAFGLEGEVTTRVDGDIVYVDVAGEQTEALIGTKGVILNAVLELCRTMVHRQSQAGARLRLDIGGYGERRREALRIYAGRLAARVLEEGGEVMLEPMNAADRKVVHDAVADMEGVRSYSEGEDPGRSVVIARSEEGVSAGASEVEGDDDEEGESE
jgi:spoIIIJ-associated protein